MNEQQLLAYNQRGLIPGPSEDEENFLKRVATLEQYFQDAFSKWEKPLTTIDWQEAHLSTSKLFDLKNDWVAGFYSNKKLSCWQGAATWIEGDIPILQLREGFLKGNYLGIYEKKDVLSHEAVHAARMAFDEPLFEEMLAYQTSKKKLHRLLGPFFKTANESLLFIALLFAPLAGQICSLFLEFEPTWVYALPIIALAFGSLRLMRSQLVFKRCLKKVERLIKEKDKALAVMMRLSDEEIISFSKWSLGNIKEYISLQKKSALRWKMIVAAYF